MNSMSLFNDFFNDKLVRGSLIDADSMFDTIRAAAKFNPMLPRNIIKTSDTTYVIEVAVAGFSKDELKVEQEGSNIRVSGSKAEKAEGRFEYLYKGIAMRDFTLPFTLGENLKVGTVELKDGVLRIVVEKKPSTLAKILEIKSED